MKLTQIILEDWKPNKYTFNGKTTQSKIAANSDNLEDFLKHLDRLPTTIKSIEVPINTKTFKTSKDYKVVQPSPGFIGDLKELVTDLTKQYEEEGEKVTFGNSTLDIIHCPGHAPGHLVFVEKEQNFCIAGDVLFRESIGRTDLPGGNHAELISSIQKKMFALDNEMVVHCGHGPSTTIGHEKVYNPHCATGL